MGLVKPPSSYDYWQKDDTYHYSPIASRIIRDKFFDLHQYLHFADNSTRYPQSIFRFLFDVTIVNSFILCKHFTHLGIRDMKTICTQLAKSLSRTPHP